MPGAKYIHNRWSYVISKTEGDGYHPSLLTGYVTALYVYCTITGESAVGQEYKFCKDVGFSSYISKNYKINPTNFDLILKSADDINGLQLLIDRYIEEKAYLQ